MKSELAQWRFLERETVKDLAYWKLKAKDNPFAQSKAKGCESHLLEIREEIAKLSAKR